MSHDFMRIRGRLHTPVGLSRLGLALLLSVFARGTFAQSPPRNGAASHVVGVWRGTSVCLVHPSPCRDEVVVYDVARTTGEDSISVDARKIVDGEEEEMGVLPCRSVAIEARVTCALPGAAWQFTAFGDTLVGELRLDDGTVFRRARAMRVTGTQQGRGP